LISKFTCARALVALQAVDAVKDIEAIPPAPVSLEEGKQLIFHFTVCCSC